MSYPVDSEAVITNAENCRCNNFNLLEYLNSGVQNIINSALRASFKNPGQMAFLLRYSVASRKAERLRNLQENLGKHIPPFLIASITTKCNLFCSGCYARANQSCHENSDAGQLSPGEWRRVFREAESLGISFILLAGGEPLLRKDVIQCAGELRNIIFPIFTNGTMIDDYTELFRQKKNLIPILSLEGSREETDGRRGDGVFEIIKSGMKTLKLNGIFFGASVTVTTENINTAMDQAFIRSLSDAGCRIFFFVEYVPVTADTSHLALTQNERNLMEQRIAALRSNNSRMLLLSFPGDEKYSGGCLAAGRGFFHINAGGGAEPCPFSPYSDVSVKDHPLEDVLQSPLFKKLAASEILSAEHSGGCVLFEMEPEIQKLIQEEAY